MPPFRPTAIHCASFSARPETEMGSVNKAITECHTRPCHPLSCRKVDRHLPFRDPGSGLRNGDHFVTLVRCFFGNPRISSSSSAPRPGSGGGGGRGGGGCGVGGRGGGGGGLSALEVPTHRVKLVSL